MSEERAAGLAMSQNQFQAQTSGSQPTEGRPAQAASPSGQVGGQGVSGSLVDDYRLLPDAPDELMAANGKVRPVWEDFVAFLSTLSQDDIAKRFARGNRYLSDAGVFFRQYGEDHSAEREWPLSHIPVLIEQTEWDEIGQGLMQRAELLEKIVSDLYGKNELIKDGHLPANLVASSPEWLRPLVGVEPAGGNHLNFLAFEIGRGPDGKWWVLGDRTQAPSGAGFALENRVATSRVFSDLYANANVHRIAGFFRNFREMLSDLKPEKDGRAAILTPGIMNDTYFEHAYIARYLGLLLLEGEDLTVEQDRLMVRTVGGLVPVSALWRRIDSSFLDPLELDENSSLGTPGLLRALRAGSVGMVNMPGAGVLETRALLAFLPKLSKRLLGEELLMPNIATWWCGTPTEREHVLKNADRMVLAPANSTGLPFFAEEAERRIDADWLAQNGAHTVAQEAVTLSTTPVWLDGKLTPRPMCLRVFLTRTEGGWQVMPGGFARIGQSRDASAIAMQRGGSVADVWVVADRSVDMRTNLQRSDVLDRSHLRRGDLPSRAADNLFWLGRYIERVEFMLRLMRSYHRRLAEAGGKSTPLIEMLAKTLQNFWCDPAFTHPLGLSSALENAQNCAARVRDLFSPDGWAVLHKLSKEAQFVLSGNAAGEDTVQALGALLRQMNGFNGMLHENMYRSTGWHFQGLGRSLERAESMLEVLAVYADEKAPEGALDLLLEMGDSATTYRRRFATEAFDLAVLDLLVLDPLNPRAVAFQLDEICEHLDFLPDHAPDQRMSGMQKLAMRLKVEILATEADELSTDRLRAFRKSLLGISNRLSSHYFG